jgi:hypothetical protein
MRGSQALGDDVDDHLMSLSGIRRSALPIAAAIVSA